MKKILCLLTITMFLLIDSQAWSQDVGSIECGMAQQTAQEAVMNGEPYKNDRQIIKVATQSIKSYSQERTISSECFNCILGQFRSGIPIWVQEHCGPAVECAHDLCVTGDPLDPACNSCVEIVCDADPWCCYGGWDEYCAGDAVFICSISCPEATCWWVGACGDQAPAGCWCDQFCSWNGDCCPDAGSECGITGDRLTSCSMSR